VNQIAAGEVIERPASVVKELVENAIDAGASEIRVELEEGGMRLIRVSDDGSGIAPADLPLALASHATSKLSSEADLHRIHTLGFRGEALASIASVSELDLLSRPAGQEAGERVVARDGEVAPGPPESIPIGTRVTVRNLFHNVPARRRFLRGERAELARVLAVLRELALAMPTVGFVAIHGGKVALSFPSGQTHRARIAEVLGSELAERLIPLSGDERLHGWIAPPDVHRRGAEGIHLFLNGRAIRDRTAISAVREGARGFQIPGRHPVAVLFLDLPPEEVDVNVHPMKREVRFRDASAVHALVRRAVRAALAGAGSAPSFTGALRMAERIAEGAGTGSGTGSDGTPSVPVPSPPPPSPRGSGGEGEGDGTGTARVRAEPVPPWARGAESLTLPAPPVRPATLGLASAAPRAFQVRSSYILLEEEDSLVVIDQHALHEKILYEEILAARENGAPSQPLLVPETVRLDAAQWPAFVEAGEALAELGFDTEEFGDSIAIVRAVPAGLGDRDPAALLRDVFDAVATAREAGSDALPDLRERLLQTLACKRAVKAGQPLTPEAIADLLRGRERAFQPRNCPHGRPAELRIGWEELARRFDRR